MSSYQQVETKLAQIERQLEFVMKAIRIAQPSVLVGMPPKVLSLLDLYHESQRAGLEISDPVEPSIPVEPPTSKVETVNG